MTKGCHGQFLALAAIAFILVMPAHAFADKVDDGMRAYEAAKYEEAFELLLPAAQEGKASAQSIIGSLYMDGKGTAQDVEEARKWFRRAALQGDDTAQFNLGVMLYNGVGGPRNDLEAYKWMLISWKSGNKNASRQFRIVSADLSRQERAEVEKMVKSWKYGDPIPGTEKTEEEPKKKRKLFVD